MVRWYCQVQAQVLGQSSFQRSLAYSRGVCQCQELLLCWFLPLFLAQAGYCDQGGVQEWGDEGQSQDLVFLGDLYGLGGQVGGDQEGTVQSGYQNQDYGWAGEGEGQVQRVPLDLGDQCGLGSHGQQVPKGSESLGDYG